MESTKESLQEEILEILYQKNLQTPTWTTCSGIAWLVKDIKVTERSVREVLDWLVKNDLVLCQADKYQISKREFIEMSKRKKIQEREMNTQESVQENADVHTPSFQSEKRCKGVDGRNVQKNNLLCVAIALVAFLWSGILIGILFFNHYAREKAPLPHMIENQDSIQLQGLQVRSMGYLKDEYTLNRNFKNISASLSEQQAVNKEMQRLLRIQQEQINCLVVLNKEQAGIIERNQRETYIYLWIIGVAILATSSLLIAWYWKRNNIN